MSSDIKIDIHKSKLIMFDLDFQGLEPQNLESKFTIDINGIQYGFPAVINDRQVEVQIPCLEQVVCNSKNLEGYIAAKLEMFSENHYYKPWDGKVKIDKPKTVKAKISKIKQPTVKKINTEDEEMGEQQEIIVDDPEPENEVNLPEPEKKKKEKKGESDLSEKVKNNYLEKLKSIDMDGIRNYMSKAGTKTESVQNIILEQAENICKDPENKFELLRSVVKVMKKIKSGGAKDVQM